ncbi:MAG TPA: Hsp20/alpha crystallin family protein [Anaerolineae bacterium]
MLWRNIGDGNRSLWREMDRLRREMDRVLQSTTRLSAPGFPALNVWTNADGVVVTAEIPGITPDDLDISITGDTLTLTGARRPEETGENVRYHRRERGFGRFTRSLQLPYRVEASQVSATFDKGVLRIDLPRAEADKPKKIQVKAAGS